MRVDKAQHLSFRPIILFHFLIEGFQQNRMGRLSHAIAFCFDRLFIKFDDRAFEYSYSIFAGNAVVRSKCTYDLMGKAIYLVEDVLS